MGELTLSGGFSNCLGTAMTRRWWWQKPYKDTYDALRDIRDACDRVKDAAGDIEKYLRHEDLDAISKELPDMADQVGTILDAAEYLEDELAAWETRLDEAKEELKDVREEKEYLEQEFNDTLRWWTDALSS